MDNDKITIKTSKGDTEVDANVIGQIASHRALSGKEYWTITHVKTGYAIIPYMKKGSLNKVMNALSVIDFDTFWNDYEHMPKEHRDLIRECQAKYCW